MRIRPTELREPWGLVSEIQFVRNIMKFGVWRQRSAVAESVGAKVAGATAAGAKGAAANRAGVKSLAPTNQKRCAIIKQLVN